MSTTSTDELSVARRELELACDEMDRTADAGGPAWDDACTRTRAAQRRINEIEDRARDGGARIEVNEPDMYTKRSKFRFFQDLYAWSIRRDLAAGERLKTHHEHELQTFAERNREFDRKGWEERAMTSGTFGGLIPPQYLLDLYAKASRNGRVFVDQCRPAELPETGMSVIIPRLTTPTAAGFQASENVAVTTQDMAETDLTVDVRTVGGYVPVSRQGLERSVYNEEILFEDLIARYWAKLDSSAISDDGTSGTFTGVYHTSGIVTSASTGGTLGEVWGNIHDVISQINANVGGLGFKADRIVCHPHRWGIFSASKDTTGRPLIGIYEGAYNIPGRGEPSGYGPVGSLAGLEVYTDANIPTNLGTNSDEDVVFVYPRELPIVWERPGDPVTLTFQETAGDALTVHLIVYGYAAFTAGRYPSGVGMITGLRAGGFS